MLPTTELERLRADIQVTLFETCDVYAVTNAADGFGGVTQTLTLSAGGVPCRMDQKRGREQLAGGGVNWFTQNMLTIPNSTTIDTTYRILYKSAYYNVISINEGSGLTVKRVIVEKIP